ncbi:protein translocase subunit SecD [Chiayiivirga flava]|uniref:Protein translocase subunit SecD n=1 Tax=Chiayiivirga flava TaxID=659595 RepID=A0A7W8FY69_9GAMM|nr:protein translocase subunit SecD [Chiayiivirga flava]MBB5206796.1 preprotein translocase subunit SecD [Chiayiivirga flava]
MLEFARWKYVLAALIFVIGALYSLPNIYTQDTAVQVTANRTGSVDTALRERVVGALDAAAIAYKSVEIEGETLLVRLADPNAQIHASDVVRDLLGSDYVVALNLASTVPAWLETIGAKPMLLGLDLQGGVHFLMEVDEAAAIEKRELGYVNDIQGLLRENKIAYTMVERANGGIAVRLRDAADRNAAAALIGREIPAVDIVDSADGSSLAVTLKQTEIRTILDNALEQNITTLRNRINAIGVAEPIVQRQGASRIVVQLPGVQDTAQAIKVLGATATLEYRAQADGNAEEAARTGRVPPDARLYYERGTRRPILLSKRIIASGDQLDDARSGMDQQGGGPKVDIKLNPAAGKRMLDFTTDNVGRFMGVVYIERIPETKIVDGKEVRTARVTEEVISYARVNGVFGRSFQTTGLGTAREASELALLLRSGSLAAPVDIVEQRVIGPSLGAENIERGWKAVTYSFVFVLIFFVAYYRVFGIVTNVALLLNMLLVVALMSLFGATLTLPGLAGIALTVGLSVDANVLINERIREELRAGTSPLQAIANGYDKAAGTIWDANVTALIAGVALFAFGTGPVKGFAVSLIAGIITSMYTAVSVSRGVATLIYGRRRKLARVSI